MSNNFVNTNSYNTQYRYNSKGLKEHAEVANQTISDVGNDMVDINPAKTMMSELVGNDPKSFVLKYWLPSWLGINFATNLFNRKLTAQEYPKTIFGKIGNACDFVTDKLSFITNPVKRTLSGVKNFYNNHILPRSQVLQSLTTPTQPVSQLVRTQAQGMRHFIATDAIDAIKKYIGKDSALWPEKLRELGMNISIDRWNSIQADPVKYSKYLAKKLTTGPAATKEVTLSSWLKFVGGSRKVTFREIGNKMQVILGLKNPNGTSALGKMFSKGGLLSLEGLTNGTMGPRIFIALNALFLAQSIKAAANAPKGEKFKTFAEEMTQLCAWLVTAPLAIKAYHTLAGLKYIGMHEAVKNSKGKTIINSTVKQFRQKIQELNTLNATGALSKADYKSRLQEIKTMFKGNSKWYQKPLKWIGNLMSTGLETINPCKNGNILDKILYPFRAINAGIKRHGIGKIGRIIAIAAVLMPMLSNACVKICHKIFGRPTKSVLDDPAKEENKTNTPTQMPNNGQSVLDILHQTKQDTRPVKRPDSSLIKIMQNNINNPQPVANSPIKNSGDGARHYIPKDTPPENIKHADDLEPEVAEKYDKMIEHADKLIERISKELA